MRKARAYWRARLAAGPLPCYRCGRPVTVDSFTVEHIVERALGGSATDVGNQWVSHPGCNMSAGGKIGAARTNARKPVAVQRETDERSRGIRGF